MNQNIWALINKHFPRETERPNQKTIIYKICEAFVDLKKNHVVLDAPTGSGKSVIAYTVGRVMNELSDSNAKTTIVTSNRNLQKQYIDDFSDIVNLWGKKNYYCPFATNYNSADCFALVKSEECNKSNCDYHNERNIWLNSNLRLTNYSFIIESCPGFFNADGVRTTLMIMDECHTIGEKIQDHCVAKFTDGELGRYTTLIGYENFKKIKQILLQINEAIKRNTKNSETKLRIDNKPLFENAGIEFRSMWSILTKKRDAVDPNKISLIHECTNAMEYFGNLAENAEMIAANMGIVMFNTGDSLKTIFPNLFTKFAIFKKSDFFLHMSATICGHESYAEEVGIDDYAFIEMPNKIPVENREVNFIPIQKVSNTQMSDEMIKSIDSAIDSIGNENGVVHTVSFTRADEIKTKSKHKNKMHILNNKEEILKVLGTKGSIILSPSMTEGFDLKDDLCRLQIVVKAPYASIGDNFQRKIFDLNNELYFRRTVLKLVQSCGRAIRHENDFALTYIFDSAFDFLKSKKSYMFPSWFKNAIR